MTLAECEAANKTAMDNYNSKTQAPTLHPGGVALYRTDSFVSDVPAARMNKAAMEGTCKDKVLYPTNREMAACIKKKMPH